MAQYLQFKPAKSHYHSPVSLHVCHNHSPASKQGKLIDGRAQRIFATLWGHVMENDRFENVDNAYQPVAVFGGDFNCRPLGWVQCLKHAMAAHKYVCKYTSVQVCTSQTIPRHLGDRAIVFNARATQEDSGWEKATSELTIRLRSLTTMTSCLFPSAGYAAYCGRPAVLHGLLRHRWMIQQRKFQGPAESATLSQRVLDSLPASAVLW